MAIKATVKSKRTADRSEGVVERPAKKTKYDPTEAGPSSAFASILSHKNAETDFPRGGGTILSALEVKEAKAEGRDEMRKLKQDRKASKGKGKKPEAKKAQEKDTVPIAHLSYKNLNLGTRTMARIVTIRPLELIVALPNQLYGHVPATSISVHFTKALNALAGQDSDDSGSDSDSESSSSAIPTLSAMFTVGQYISVAVSDIKTADASRRALAGPRKADEEYRKARRVELSINPASAHDGMTKKDLISGLTLTAAVQSLEDNGYVLDLGVEGVTSFVSSADAAKANGGKRWILGQPVPCRISKMSGNGRTCAVSIVAPQDDYILAEPPSVAALLPNNLVRGLVTAVLPNGLNVKLFGLFDATVNLYQVPTGQDLAKTFKIGQKLKARIVWSADTTIALSVLPHVLKADHSAVDTINDAFPVGHTFDAVQVVRVESDHGVVCEIPGPSSKDAAVAAFVHLSKVSDEHIASVHAARDSYDVGSFHKARVVGFAAFEGIVQLSFQKSILGHSFLRVADIKIGDSVKATVKSLTKDALFVDVSGSVQGIVWPVHFSDIKLKNPEKRFKAGSIVKARIFSTDPERQRVVLTLKKSLVGSELPVLSSIDEATPGKDLDAVIFKITAAGLLVEMFGGITAFVPIAELSDEFFRDIKDIQTHFTVGQAVKVRLLKVDAEQGQILASVVRALSEKRDARKDATALEVGQAVKAKVIAVHQKQFVLGMEGFATKGLLSTSVVAKHEKIEDTAAGTFYSIGQAVETLIVNSIDVPKNLAILGYARRAKAPQDGISNVLTFDKVEVDQIIEGKLTMRKAASSIVSLGRGLSARLHFTDAADDYDTVESLLASDEVLPFKILSVDRELKQIDVSSRPSVVSGSTNVRDPVVAELADLKPFIGLDRKVRGFVVSISNAGVFVAISRDLTARVQIKELFDEFVQEWKPRFTLGQVVAGRILSVNESEEQVEMSLRQNKPKTTAKAASVSSFSVGQRVTVVVKRVESFGVFLRVQGSSVSGLCHKSEVHDSDTKAWDKDLQVGSERQAVVIEVVPDKQRIAFSLKQSRVGVMSTQVSEQSDEEEDDSMVIRLPDEDETSASEAGDAAADTAMPLALALDPIPAKPLAVSSTFGNVALAKRQREEESSDDEDVSRAAKVPRATLQAADVTADLQANQPTSAADFERLLLTSPNSSLLWISYMALHVSTSDLAMARKTAKRALATINFRELAEKFNVWVALLNLENQYGTDADFQKVFQDAVKANTPKAIYLKACELLTEGGKTTRAQELHEETLKKFPESSKVWTLFAAFLFGTSKAEDARALLPRSLKALPKRKHVKTITRMAGLEFKMGDPEMGRTLFEGILETQPKRLDLLSVYVDLEIKAGNYASARSLFKRALDRKLTTKKAKWLFKKFLKFEEEHGTATTQAEVKDLAADFVAAQQIAAEGEEAEA